ncbi:hypothetical protein NKH18_36095 [Streptomyces sp. M10(2022)]
MWRYYLVDDSWGTAATGRRPVGRRLQQAVATREKTMINHYELHKINAAELRRRAEEYRTVRQVVLARRAAWRSRRDDTGGR